MEGLSVDLATDTEELQAMRWVVANAGSSAVYCDAMAGPKLYAFNSSR